GGDGGHRGSANLGPDGVRQATGVVLVEAPGGGGPIGRFEPAQIAGGLDEDHEQRRDVGQIDGGFELGSGQGVRHRQNRTGSPPGTSPIWTCGSAKTAFSPAKTRSPHRAMVQPRPMAGPCTTAIDGWGRFVSVRNTRAPMRATSSLSTSPSYIWRMKLMSPPAQNARPAPSRTRTRTAPELAMRSSASPRAWYRGQSMAFSCSGRSKVSTPTPAGVNSNRSPGRAGPMMSLVPTHFLSLAGGGVTGPGSPGGGGRPARRRRLRPSPCR